jgi:hypothetical protein
MKGIWEGSDLIAMYQRRMRFNGQQCRRIAECCRRKSETELAQKR